MKKQLFSLLSAAILFSCSPPKQQVATTQYVDAPDIEALQKDTNIQYLGMVEHLFSFSQNPASDQEKYGFYKSVCSKNETRPDRWFDVLKHSIKLHGSSISDYIEMSDPVYVDSDGFMMNLLLDQLDEMDAFEDKALSIKLDAAQKKKLVLSIDTILMFDPETLTEKKYVVENVLDPRDVYIYKVSAIAYYDKQKTEMVYHPLAIAPMKTIFDDEGNPQSIEELFWLPVQVTTQYPNIGQPEYTFSQLHQNHVSPNNVLDTNLRKQYNTYAMDQVDRIRENAGQLYIPTIIHGEPNDSTNLANLGSSVDSILIFDPETFEEKITVVKNELSSVESVRMTNIWSLNQATRQIECYQFGYSFIIDRLDDNGNVINSGPIFFHKTK